MDFRDHPTPCLEQETLRRRVHPLPPLLTNHLNQVSFPNVCMTRLIGGTGMGTTHRLPGQKGRGKLTFVDNIPNFDFHNIISGWKGEKRINTEHEQEVQAPKCDPSLPAPGGPAPRIRASPSSPLALPCTFKIFRLQPSPAVSLAQGMSSAPILGGLARAQAGTGLSKLGAGGLCQPNWVRIVPPICERNHIA